MKRFLLLMAGWLTLVEGVGVCQSVAAEPGPRARTFLSNASVALSATHWSVNPARQQGVYWRRQVTFVSPVGDRLQVDAETGTVTSFWNQALAAQLQGDKRPAGVTISKLSALTLARQVLRYAGSDPGDVPGVAILSRVDEPPTAGGQTWIVSYKRTTQGIPYRNQQATVILAAETGQPLALGLAFKMVPGSPGQFSVSSQRAIAIARGVLDRHGITTATFHRAFREFVEPNSRWENRATPPANSTPSPPVAVWHVEFDESRQRHEVWVDGKSGRVVGGETAGLPRRMPPNDR